MNKRRKRELPEDKKELFFEMLKDISKTSRFSETEYYIQHGKTTVKSHCINVAYTAYYISYKLKIAVNERELVRGALLHDYFLYDWHEKSLKNSIHGYTHPELAFREADKDFDLSMVERDMIKHHMFPLTIRPPRSTEGKILCLADKLCAIKETVRRK